MLLNSPRWLRSTYLFQFTFFNGVQTGSQTLRCCLTYTISLGRATSDGGWYTYRKHSCAIRNLTMRYDTTIRNMAFVRQLYLICTDTHVTILIRDITIWPMFHSRGNSKYMKKTYKVRKRSGRRMERGEEGGTAAGYSGYFPL